MYELGPRNSANSSPSVSLSRSVASSDGEVGLAVERTADRLVLAGVRHDIAGRLDHEQLVQVGDTEVVHRVAVVVAERDHGRRRLDHQVEVEQGLGRAGERLQPHLVEALEDGTLVAVARAMAQAVPHAITI